MASSIPRNTYIIIWGCTNDFMADNDCLWLPSLPSPSIRAARLRSYLSITECRRLPRTFGSVLSGIRLWCDSQVMSSPNISIFLPEERDRYLNEMTGSCSLATYSINQHKLMYHTWSQTADYSRVWVSFRFPWVFLRQRFPQARAHLPPFYNIIVSLCSSCIGPFNINYVTCGLVAVRRQLQNSFLK